MATLAELDERRRYELRLTPDRALQSLEEAEDFVRERGLVTRTAQSSLPSLYEPCPEERSRPAGRVGAPGPETTGGWWGELPDREGIFALKIHRGKHILVSEEVAVLIDPILRSEIARLREAEEDWALLLDHLEAVGPSELEDLQEELGLSSKALKAARSPLERCGAVVSRSLAVSATAAGPHPNTTELARWDHVHPEPSGVGGLEDLTVAAVRAAVVAPEREALRWFSWVWLYRKTLVDELVAEGRLYRPAPGVISATETAS